MRSKLAFKYVCKAFTGGIYREIVDYYRQRNFNALRHYNTAMIRLLEMYGADEDIVFEKDHKLLYRGLTCDATADYKKH